MSKDFDIDDPSGRELAERAAAARMEYEQQLWAKALMTEEGRFLACFVLEQSGFYRASFSDDDRLTSFREGRRSIGSIVRDAVLAVHRQRLEQLEREAEEREELYRARAGAG